jgi:hypothetical protein
MLGTRSFEPPREQPDVRWMNGSLEIECRIDPKFFENPDNMAEIGSGFSIY